MRSFLGLALLLLALPAAAQDMQGTPHPALWKVQGKHSTVYLLGSIHLLSPAIAWRDTEIETVIYDADTYLFETSIDPNLVQRVVAEKGSLPQGQSLRALLPAQSQQDFDADLASVNLPEANVDTRRPWLATLALTSVKFAQSGSSPYAGVDYSITSEVQARGKPIRYLETIEQQMALIVPADPKLELEAFEVFLKGFRNERDDLAPLTAAWLAGDQDRIATAPG